MIEKREKGEEGRNLGKKKSLSSLQESPPKLEEKGR